MNTKRPRLTNTERVLLAQTKICSICNALYLGWGHNAQPVNDGRCCDLCNDTDVIPARLLNYFTRAKQ